MPPNNGNGASGKGSKASDVATSATNALLILIVLLFVLFGLWVEVFAIPAFFVFFRAAVVTVASVRQVGWCALVCGRMCGLIAWSN